uniref:Proline-rich protein PRCC n=1 Tax=Panagrellus redivivus TaxID=6233 RepID=A0A7E4VNW4_PANRE
MLGLSAYGSDSDSDAETPSVPVVKTVPKEVVPPPKPAPAPVKIDEDESETTPKLNLPKAAAIKSFQYAEEDDIEEFIKTKRDAEKKLAAEVRPKSKGKKKIDAFGGLSNRAFQDDDDGYVAQKPTIKEVAPTSSSFKSSLLSSLPPPKSSSISKPATSTTAFLPSAVRSKAPVPPKMPKTPALPTFDDEEDEIPGPSTDDNDLFGLGSVKKQGLIDPSKLQKTDAAPALFLMDEDIGPARPVPVAVQQEPQQSDANIKHLTDDDAKKLVYRYELQHTGASNIIANDCVSGMVDVNVDNTLGPNIRENLLKNLDHRKMATVFPANSEGKVDPKAKKGPANKLAKMKNQVTHLAGIAVAREEELQEQWAKNRETKTAAKRKYGF